MLFVLRLKDCPPPKACLNILRARFDLGLSLGTCIIRDKMGKDAIGLWTPSCPSFRLVPNSRTKRVSEVHVGVKQVSFLPFYPRCLSVLSL